MPTSTGTSVRGLQFLGTFPASGVGWELRFASNPPQDRLNRVGTVLHTVPITNNRDPVIAVYKLYGSGVRPPLVDIPTYVGTAIWVNWFEAGLVWFFQRADP